MDEMEQKLGAVLGNPELMQKIMAMAQSLGQPAQPPSGIPIHSYQRRIPKACSFSNPRKEYLWM